MQSYLTSDARRVLRDLRATYPCPVRIRTVPSAVLERHHDCPVYGDCLSKDGYWLIRISRGISEPEMIDVIAHEYSHALDEMLNGPAPRDCHRASWGQCYAKCVKVVKG